jgi:hypothetical protein
MNPVHFTLFSLMVQSIIRQKPQIMHTQQKQNLTKVPRNAPASSHGNEEEETKQPATYLTPCPTSTHAVLIPFLVGQSTSVFSVTRPSL